MGSIAHADLLAFLSSFSSMSSRERKSLLFALKMAGLRNHRSISETGDENCLHSLRHCLRESGNCT